MKNGSYQVKFNHAKEVQNVKIEVYYKNENNDILPIRGSPFVCGFKAGVSPKNNELAGP